MTGTTRKVVWVLAWGAFALVAGSVLLAGLRGPLGYDEAYNLQVPLHLLRDGHYATDGAVYGAQARRDFDVYISTGPTVLVPVAAVMAVAGKGLWAARLFPSLCYVALLVLAGVAGRRVGGAIGALAAVLGVLAVGLCTDGAIGLLGSGDVLGEIPATALVLAAALLVTRRPRLAGLLLGLAVLTKLLVLLALPVLLLVAFFGAERATRGARLRSALGLALLAALPNVVWQVVQLAVLGPQLWLTRLREFWVFFATAGSGLVADPRYQRNRFATVAQMWSAPALTTVLLVAAAVAAFCWCRSADRRLTVPRDVAAAAWAAGGSGVVLLLWWAGLSGRPMGRYLVTPLMLLVVATVPLVVLVLQRAAAAEGPRRGRPLRLVLAALVVGLGLQSVVHAVQAGDPAGPSLAQQRVVAAAVRADGLPLTGAGWWQAPEISFLASEPSRPLGAGPGLLVLSDVEHRLAPTSYAEGRARCDQVRLRVPAYLLCEVGVPRTP